MPLPRRAMVRLGGACALALVASVVPRAAHASSAMDDPYDLPDAPRSMTLPELTHPDVEWTSVSTIGVIHAQRPPSQTPHTTPTLVQSLALEVPLGHRRWFAGVDYQFAGGPPGAEGGAPILVGGNVEIYGRTVWATRTGLAFGGGIGVIPALATYARSGRGADVALAAAAMEPWDYAFFQPGVHSARAFADVRDLVGAVMIQLRQTFIVSAQASDLGDRALSASTTLYVGYRLGERFGVGLEATELYFIDAPVEDERRAHFVVAPTLRFVTPTVKPALSAFAAIGNPLYPQADSVWGFRLALTVTWDPRPAEPPAGTVESPAGTAEPPAGAAAR